MKKKSRNILLGLVILSLLFIGGVVTTSFLKSKPQEKTISPDGNNVLGQTTQLISTAPTVLDNVNNLIQSSLQNTKEIVSQKVVEAEKTILTTINKEISTMTQTQVDNLKWQICRDLGVVSVSPTP